MRKVLEYFIRYSVAVNVIVLAFAVFGIFGLSNLKSSFFPLIEPDQITINVTYPGASPQEIEEGIIVKIEDNLRGLIGIDRITSIARENSGLITVEILRGENIDNVLADVKNAVDRVPSYPTDMEPIVVAKDEPVRETIQFAISGQNIPLAELKQMALSIENDLRGLPGISQISITGYPDEEIEIAVRENDLLAYNLTFQEVALAVRSTNIFTTGGTVKTDAEDFLIRANNRNYFAQDIENIVIRATPSGGIVRARFN